MSYIRTISQLQEISAKSLGSGSYFETSHCLSAGLYVSRKISKEELEKLASDSAIKTLTDEYGLSNGCNIGNINTNVDKILNKECTFDGKKTFNDVPDIGPDVTNEDSDAESYYNNLDLTNLSANGNKAINAKMLNTFTSINFAPQINSEFGFGTLLSNINNNKSVTYTALDGVTLQQAFNKVFENEFIFKINQKENISNVWISPASGIFTCYGWLGEAKSNAVNNSARWVALEAYNSKLGNGNWSILQLQPFIPNNFCSYVSFSFPVKAGLKLRIKTGFTVSTNSDKYFNAQGSLTNHVLNAFVGGVYTVSLDPYLMSNNNNNDNDNANNAIYVDEDTFRQTLEELDKHYDNKYIDEDELSTALFDFVSNDKLSENLALIKDNIDNKYIDEDELSIALNDLSNSINEKIDKNNKLEDTFENAISIYNDNFKLAFDIKRQNVIKNGNMVQIYLSASRSESDLINNTLENNLRYLDKRYYDLAGENDKYKSFAKIESNLGSNEIASLQCKIHASYRRQPKYNYDGTSGDHIYGSPIHWYSTAIAYINNNGEIEIDFDSIFPHLKNKCAMPLEHAIKYPAANYTPSISDPLSVYYRSKYTDNTKIGKVDSYHLIQSIVISGTYLLKSAKE